MAVRIGFMKSPVLYDIGTHAQKSNRLNASYFTPIGINRLVNPFALNSPSVRAASFGILPDWAILGVLMDVYLQLGAHHTASGALIRACHENLHHFDQPQTEIWGRQDPRLINMMKLARDPSADAAKSKDQATRALNLSRVHLQEATKAGAQAVMLDAANVLGTRQDNLRNRRLYPRASERLSRLLPVFEGCNVHFLLGLRTYEAYWSSVLFKAVSNGVAQPDDDVLDYLVTQPMRWRHLVEGLEGLTPNGQVHVWTFEAFGNRPTDLIAPLYCAKKPEPDFDAPSKELADALRADPLWNAFEPYQTAALREQYLDDIKWLQSSHTDGVTYHAPKRDDRTHHAQPKQSTVVTPRRVTPSRGTAHDRQQRTLG